MGMVIERNFNNQGCFELAQELGSLYAYYPKLSTKLFMKMLILRILFSELMSNEFKAKTVVIITVRKEAHEAKS